MIDALGNTNRSRRSVPNGPGHELFVTERDSYIVGMRSLHTSTDPFPQPTSDVSVIALAGPEVFSTALRPREPAPWGTGSAIAPVSNDDDPEEDAGYDDGFGLDHRDLSLSLDWKTLPQVNWEEVLDLPPLSSRKKHARDAILSVAIAAQRLAYPGVSYSRRKAFYVGKQRYYGPTFTHATIVQVVDQLGGLDLLELWTPAPGVGGLQSTFCATPHLLEAVSPSLKIVQRPRELIWLRDENRRLLDYQDNRQTNGMRRNLIQINEALEAISIRYPGYDLGRLGQAFRVGKSIVYPTKVQYRIFNLSFRRGGRFYGGGWQCAPKVARRQITIDGEPVVEHDHPQLHPRLLYCRRGVPLNTDPYDLPGWERNTVKRAFNTLINAGFYQEALGAIACDSNGIGHAPFG